MMAALARALGASIGKVVMTDTRLEDGNMAPTIASGSPSEGLPTKVASVDAPCLTSNSVTTSVAPSSSVQATVVTKDIPHDPMVYTDTFDVVEEAVEDASLDPENFETAADQLASEDVPYEPMVHNDTSDMMEEALEISSDCVLLADLAGVIQANGDDLVHDAIIEDQPTVAKGSTIPPPRPQKRQASSSDPSKAKRSRPSTSSTT
ncbi:hypothetical protein V6N12_042948 [Hibiscus sabdariffa]|uniref:Uncharacterized protein n=1 Tax=Hibiscus sabdariffa TaxID=183260 RepID=A0ABR2AXJ4_9ROSI